MSRPGSGSSPASYIGLVVARARDERDSRRARLLGRPGEGPAILESAPRQPPAQRLPIAEEFRTGFEAVEQDRPARVTIFGSARVGEDHPIYQTAQEVGRRFAEAGFAVVTGGGPGVMEAANRGAQEAGGLSVGFNIDLPHEQHHNPYLDIG